MDLAQRTAPADCTASRRFRWIADLLDLADQAVTVIARAEGFDYPRGVHVDAQQDLRAWARWLDEHPEIASELDDARADVAGLEGEAPAAYVLQGLVGPAEPETLAEDGPAEQSEASFSITSLHATTATDRSCLRPRPRAHRAGRELAAGLPDDAA
jgi:hypothetical protein